jgi:hypothetical protein
MCVVYRLPSQAARPNTPDLAPACGRWSRSWRAGGTPDSCRSALAGSCGGSCRWGSVGGLAADIAGRGIVTSGRGTWNGPGRGSWAVLVLGSLGGPGRETSGGRSQEEGRSLGDRQEIAGGGSRDRREEGPEEGPWGAARDVRWARGREDRPGGSPADPCALRPAEVGA